VSTQIEIAQVVAIISAAYPNFSPTKETIEVYYQTLQDLNFDELKAATMQSISEAGRKFAPSVGELRGAVLSIRKRIAGVPSSYQAWQEVLKQISENGGDFGKPVWSNQIVKQAVDALGWRNLRMSEDQTQDRARFIMAYDQLLQRAGEDEIALPAVKAYMEQAKIISLETTKVAGLLEKK
jgi:hypothetical protein